MGLRVGNQVRDYRGQSEGGTLIANIGGRRFEVYDGDTLFELDENNTRISNGLRIQGVQARETQKINPETGQVDFGEVGGATDKHALFEFLKTKSDDLDFVDLGGQQIGRGSGDRTVVDFVDRNTGYGISTQLAEAGLSRPTSWESKEDYEARKAGELRRSAQGEYYDPLSGVTYNQSELTGLRDLVQETRFRDDQYRAFKTTALNEQWFDPELHTNVDFRNRGTVLWDSDREQGGFASDPVGTAWDVGWANVYADTGAFLHSLGVAFDSENLQDYGNAVRIRNNRLVEQAAPFAISQLSDIETDKGFLTTLGDSFEWVAVNGTMSLPYMGAIAGAGIAAAATSPLSGTAFLASAPAMAIHAGTIWNDVDPENRNRSNLGTTYTAALGNTILDRVGFAGIIPGKSVLTKEGSEKLAAHIAKRDGISIEDATKIINKTGKEEAEKFLRHNADVAGEFLQRSSMVRDVSRALATAAPAEAVTEALQEANSYITAARINGEEIDDRELINILANSAAAGFAIGGIAGGVTQIPTSLRNNRNRRRWTEQYDPEVQDAYLLAIEKEEDALGIPYDQRDNTSLLNTIREFAKDDTTTQGYFSDLAVRGSGSTVASDLFQDEDGNVRIPTPGEALSRIAKSAARLTKAPTRNEIRPEDLKNPALRYLYKLVDFHGGGGRNYEGYRDYLQGTFQNIISGQDAFATLGIAPGKSNARAVSNQIRSLGNAGILKRLRENGFVFDKLSDSDKQQFANISGKINPKALTEVVRKLNNATETMWQVEYDAIVKEYGKDSKEAKAFGKIEDYYWKKSEVDRAKVAKDPKGFQQFLKDAIADKLKDPNLSSAHKEALKRMKPSDITNRIVNDGEQELFSMVGGQKFVGGSSRLLDLSERKDFAEKFGEENIFASLSQAGRDTAKRAASMEYFGDGGRLLDSLSATAIQYEIQVNGLTEEQARHKIARVASDYKDIIDASSNNYRRIKNPTIAKAQRVLLSYTSIVGLPLAAASSIPEFGTMAIDIRSDTDAMNGLKNIFNVSRLKESFTKFIGPLGVPLGSYETVVDVDGKKEVLRSKAVQDEMFNQLEQVGIPVDVSDVYNKWGLEGAEPVSDLGRSLHNLFFKATLIEPVTYMQRTMNAGFALDFMRDRLDILMGHQEGTPFNKVQGNAYYDLKSLGMNVDAVLEKLKSKDINAFDLNYNTELGTGAQAKAQSVNSVQEKARANGISYEQQVLSDLMDSRSGDLDTDRFLNDQIAIVMQNFINQKIQNPGAANRPLLVQDPRFDLVNQFNGFISTVTTTLVPKLWNGKVGAAMRTKDPDLAYEAFAFVVLMVGLGAMGQFVKDVLKGNEEDLNPLTHPYYDFDELVQRSFFASGIFGQFEKPISWVLPTPFERDESVGWRAGSDFAGPTFRHGENIVGAIQKGITGYEAEGPYGGTYEVKPNWNRGLNELLKSVPLFSVHAGLRHKVSGLDTDK